MNYPSLTDTISDDVMEAIDIILNPEIDPEIRQYNLEILLREVGEKAYTNVYDMAAYDMMIEYTDGIGIEDTYYALAKNLSDSVVTGGKDAMREYVYEWVTDQILKAEQDAFYTAQESGQYCVLTRTEAANCCKWCASLVGTFIEPVKGSNVWKRHDNCRGSVSVEGYRSRNGLLRGNGHGWTK